jgi:hypothetical protein
LKANRCTLLWGPSSFQTTCDIKGSSGIFLDDFDVPTTPGTYALTVKLVETNATVTFHYTVH